MTIFPIFVLFHEYGEIEMFITYILQIVRNWEVYWDSGVHDFMYVW